MNKWIKAPGKIIIMLIIGFIFGAVVSQFIDISREYPSQEVELGYRDSIYSPTILDYRLDDVRFCLWDNRIYINNYWCFMGIS